MQHHREHARLVNQLGGAAALGHLIDEKPVNIRQWKRRGIPWHWRSLIAQLAAARGVNVPRGFQDRRRRAA